MQKSSNDLFSRIFESSREFKKVTTITTCAMFGALSVVLGYYSFKITPNLKIGFGSIPNMLVDYLFGPVVGGLFGGAMDVIKFMLKPDGGFMPGFTFNAMLAAFIYGLFFYKKNLSLPRILTAKLVVIVLCNIVLGTYWLTLLNGKGFLAILPARKPWNRQECLSLFFMLGTVREDSINLLLTTSFECIAVKKCSLQQS